MRAVSRRERFLLPPGCRAKICSVFKNRNSPTSRRRAMSRGWSLRGSATTARSNFLRRGFDIEALYCHYTPSDPLIRGLLPSVLPFYPSSPPHDEQKEIAGRKEKAEPPDATPRLAERRAKRGAEQPFRSAV